MGVVGSKIYGQGKRLVMRYNAEHRANKLLEKGKLPPAPRHETIRPLPEIQLSREALEDIHCKNVQLNEHLKKVYLTSTSKIIGSPSTRPKPKKENEKLKTTMFYEPKTPAPGCCTLSNVIEILLKFQPDSDSWNVDGIARRFNLDKKDVVLLVTYYSLYRHETFDFMNQEVNEVKKVKVKETDDADVRLLKKEERSLRQIESK